MAGCRGESVARLLWFLPLLACFALMPAVRLSGPVYAQTTGASSAKLRELRSRQDAERRLLLEKRSREFSVQRDMDQLSNERTRLNKRLVETARAVKDGERRLTEIETSIGDLESQEKVLRNSLAKQHDTIAKLLGAMQRMGRNPPPVMITRRKDALKMVRSAMLLAATFPELRESALKISGEINKLSQIVERSRAQAAKLKQEAARHDDTRTRLSALMEEKRQSLGEREAELQALRRDTNKIKQSVADLSDLIDKLDVAMVEQTRKGLFQKQMRRRAELEKTKKALADRAAVQLADKRRREEERRRLALAGPPKGAVPQPPPAGGLPSLERPNSVVMLPKNGVSTQNPGRLEPSVAFFKTKGHLQLPAVGSRVVSFGEQTESGTKSKGIVIETRHGAQVTSPSDGWIVYAGEFRSYGQLLIINAGRGYHILLANLSQIDVQLGQFVLAGEPVGTMSTANSRSKKSQKDNAPVLYVEFRKEGQPINPRPWWVKDTRKVQG